MAREAQVLWGRAGSLPPGTDATNAVFEIGAISKVFTGLLLAQAVESGELKLEDSLGERWPKQVPPGTPAASLTLRQLVTQTACLPYTLRSNGPDAAAMDEMRTLTAEQLWAALPSMRPIGTAPCRKGYTLGTYSELGFALLGRLLEVHHGKPWGQLVQERIAGPLGMHDTALALSTVHHGRLLPAFKSADPCPPGTSPPVLAREGFGLPLQI